MGLALGYTVATPTIISLMQSCKQDSGPVWTPVFFSPEEGAVIMQLADLILPKTDTPSATEVGVHTFLDRYMKEVSESEEQALMKLGIGNFMEKAMADSGKQVGDTLTTEELEPVLAGALKKREIDEEAKIYETLMTYNEAVAQGQQAELDGDVSRFAFANQFRDAVIWSYKTSEYVGEEVLAYLPVPGEYIGCADLAELTGGKAWSIS
ncbi:gluconate 2-dehydrogenase subunit 3 family protein [Robiginitalea sp.]